MIIHHFLSVKHYYFSNPILDASQLGRQIFLGGGFGIEASSQDEREDDAINDHKDDFSPTQAYLFSPRTAPAAFLAAVIPSQEQNTRDFLKSSAMGPSNLMAFTLRTLHGG